VDDRDCSPLHATEQRQALPPHQDARSVATTIEPATGDTGRDLLTGSCDLVRLGFVGPLTLPQCSSQRPERSFSPEVLIRTRERGMAMGNYEREPLDELEEVRGVFYGSYGQIGQQFVITNRRLLLAPIKLIKNVANDVAIEASAYIAGQLTVPGADLVGKILQAYAPFDPHTIWLRHIVSVRAGDNGGMFKAPQLVYTTDTEDVESIGVVRNMWSPNFVPGNRSVRDQMVDVLTKAVADAKRASGQ